MNTKLNIKNTILRQANNMSFLKKYKRKNNLKSVVSLKKLIAKNWFISMVQLTLRMTICIEKELNIKIIEIWINLKI
jgi:hypothetical protein